MSYNLESRVERLERHRPENPLEHLSEAELQARLSHLNDQLSELLGFNTRPMDMADHRMLMEADARGGDSVNTVAEQLRRKYGPPLPRAGS
jgi:hypothetical protein